MKIVELKKGITVECPTCGGYGKVWEGTCPDCNGVGDIVLKQVDIKVVVIGNVAFVNTCPHPINGVYNGEEVVIPPCGYLLNATPEEKFIEEKFGIEFIKTEFIGTEEGWAFIDAVERDFTLNVKNHVRKTIIIGSAIATKAFPGVCGLTPMPGHERVAPALKKMNLNKFTIVEKED